MYMGKYVWVQYSFQDSVDPNVVISNILYFYPFGHHGFRCYRVGVFLFFPVGLGDFSISQIDWPPNSRRAPPPSMFRTSLSHIYTYHSPLNWNTQDNEYDSMTLVSTWKNKNLKTSNVSTAGFSTQQVWVQNVYIRIYIYIYLPRTQMTHIFEDLTHRMEGHPFKKEVSWGLGI